MTKEFGCTRAERQVVLDELEGVPMSKRGAMREPRDPDKEADFEERRKRRTTAAMAATTTTAGGGRRKTRQQQQQFSYLDLVRLMMKSLKVRG